jgi:hypothetical protein
MQVKNTTTTTFNVWSFLKNKHEQGVLSLSSLSSSARFLTIKTMASVNSLIVLVMDDEVHDGVVIITDVYIFVKIKTL